MIHTYEYNGQTLTIRLERKPDGSYSAQLGDETVTFDAQPLQDGGWLLTLDGTQQVVHVAPQGDSRHVHAGGHAYDLTATDARRRRKGAAAEAGDLTAQMPGQVMDVRVTEGDPVNAGQPLVILEAMKMEIRVTAPSAGVVRRVLVTQGDVVERGQTLVEVQAHQP